MGPADDAVHLRGFLKPGVTNGELSVDYSFAVAYALKSLKEPELSPDIVIVRREGTLAFVDAVSGDVGLPFPSYIGAVSDHSACKSKWPYPAFTQVWLKPITSQTAPNPTASQSADLTDPNDSLRDITECFTNTGNK